MARVPRAALAAILMAAILLAGTPVVRAESRVTVTVAWGGVAACGIGFFVYLSQTWSTGFDSRPPGPALLNLREGSLFPGLPIPGLVDRENGRGRWAADLFRWSF